MRHRRLRSLGAILLAALLLVPVVSSGHFHASHGTTPCAACAVTQHTPVASAPALAMPAAVALVLDVGPVAAAMPAGPAVHLVTTRGPPPRHLAQVL